MSEHSGPADPFRALYHFPQEAPWSSGDDGADLVWRPEWPSWEGVFGGWAWATDSSTAAGRPTTDSPVGPKPMAEKVVGWLAGPRDPTWAVKVAVLAVLGGWAEVGQLGAFHLDRVWQAASWVSGDSDHDHHDPEDEVLLVVVPHGSGSYLRITSASTDRVAVVVNAKSTGDPSATYTDGYLPSIFPPMRRLDDGATSFTLVGEVLEALEQAGGEATAPELAVALSAAGVTAERSEVLAVLRLMHAHNLGEREGHPVWTMASSAHVS